ncbi:hypothetical protein ACFLTD_02835 [Elusimicrobiota bacterium]
MNDDNTNNNKENLFDYFKERFVYYQDKCGLKQWDITFKESKQKCRARIVFDTDYYATLYFNPNLKRWKQIKNPHKDIDNTIKHEIAHLIIGNLYLYSIRRFDINKQRIDDEIEGICNLIEKLI